MLTDTHAHLDFPDFAEDFAEVIQRAEAAGIKRFISIGTTLESSRRAISLSERHPQIYATAGIHPCAAEEAPADVMDQLRAIAVHPRVVAIGEIGLDYHRLPEDKPLERQASIDKQSALFQQQLDLAIELGLNAVIHQRSSWDDTVSILEKYTGRIRTVFHCFGESLVRAKHLISMNHLVSFTGIVTFKNARTVQEAAAALPQGTFMVETDCPYLAPVPYRGKRCEPAYTRQVAEHIATLRGESVEDIARQTEEVAEGFFRFGK